MPRTGGNKWRTTDCFSRGPPLVASKGSDPIVPVPTFRSQA